jgi:hypothetical protein
MPTTKKGEPAHVQGFILYKLWLMGCWARAGAHGKSIDLEHDLPTNYDKQFKPAILEQAAELKKRPHQHLASCRRPKSSGSNSLGRGNKDRTSDCKLLS